MARALLLISAALAACEPETSLHGQPRTGVGGGPGPPGELTLVAPVAGGEVPVNLAAVVVRSPRPLRVEGTAGALAVRAAGRAQTLGPLLERLCAEGEGVCHEAALPQPLPAGVSARLELARPLVTTDGASLFPGALGAISVVREPDREPPLLGELEIMPAGDCMRVRVRADEPAGVEVLLRASGEERRLWLGSGGTVFDRAFRLQGLPGDTPFTATLTATDLAGNSGEPVIASGRTPAAAPLPIVISEVLGNPAGPETTQEWVELRNVGEVSVNLGGLVLEDEAGADRLPAGELAPGAHALVVGGAWVAEHAADTPPRTGTLILGVTGRLGKDGLANGGEIIRLRTAEGVVVSSYGGWVNTDGSAWSGRSVHRAPDERACDHPRAWTRTPLSPTPGW